MNDYNQWRVEAKSTTVLHIRVRIPVLLSSVICYIMIRSNPYVSFLGHRGNKTTILVTLTPWRITSITPKIITNIPFTDWLTGWLTGWLTDWLTHWLAGWLTDWLIDRPTDWLSHSLTHLSWVRSTRLNHNENNCFSLDKSKKTNVLSNIDIHILGADGARQLGRSVFKIN